MHKRSRYLSLIPIYVFVLCSFIIIGFGGSKFITVLSENAPITDRNTIVIDAGHGGEDGGATSCTGVLESQINLEIALKLDDLMHLLGIKTVMIRSTDTSVYTSGDSIAARKVSDLRERVRIVNETENAILVSIHQNQFSDGQYHGAQVFYGPTGGSDQLAKLVQDALVQAVNPGSKRQTKKAEGVYLMQHIDCTGVLIECGFLSNPAEESLLRNEEYQKKICCVIASCCSRYLSGTVQVT